MHQIKNFVVSTIFIYLFMMFLVYVPVALTEGTLNLNEWAYSAKYTMRGFAIAASICGAIGGIVNVSYHDAQNH